MSADTVTALDQYLAARRADVERALERFLPTPPETPSVVADAMRYSLLAGGKRLRPLLTLTAADALGGEHARALAMPAACAIEMIHTYSLVHDDLPAMDDDVLRRGRPTLHVVAGEGMAILAGDGLQTEAFRLLAREPQSVEPHVTERKLRVIELIASAAGSAGMVGGQAIDLDAVRPGPERTSRPMTGDDLRGMHARKTGAIIRAATVAGAVMAGADVAIVNHIDRYAAEVGLAFQIVDDILDVEAGSDALGKTAGKDAAAGKPTYPALYGLTKSRELAAECLERAEVALTAAGLHDSHLAGIARVIVSRHS